MMFNLSIKAETITYYVNDALGSPIATMNSSGTLDWKESYHPYGESRINPSQNDDDIGYTGHQKDSDTGLTYMQARYYDPVVGRFYSNNPVGFTTKNPVMSFNRYMYVNNNPYKYNDPDGEFLFLAVVPLAKYTVGYAIFDVLVVGAVVHASSYDTDDGCLAGTSGCIGSNKGKKGKEKRFGKKKDRDNWGKYSGKKYKKFRKWWENEKAKNGGRDLDTEEDRDEAYKDFQADQGQGEEEQAEEQQEEQQDDGEVRRKKD